MGRPWSIAVLTTAAVSAFATLAVVLLPQLHFAYWQPLLHAALETAASLIALLASFLFFGRARRTRLLNELLLAGALAVLAVLNLFLLAVPAVVAQQAPPELIAWIALASSLLGAILFALAAFASPIRLRRGLVLAGEVAGVAVAVLAAAVAGGLIARLPQGITSLRLPGLPVRPDLHARPEVLALQLIMSLIYGLAAIGFSRRSRRPNDQLPGWLAIAAILAAVSHVNYALYPSLFSQWVHTGDAFRLCFYVTLLVGSMRELWSYWHRLSDMAVLEERQRLARDLHDGLGQELVYLARNLDSLDGNVSGDTLKRLLRSVERAQFESRRAVGTLAAPTGQAIEITLANALGEIADRFHIALDLDIAAGVRLPAARAEALVRIACEAVTNAARHSGSSQVRVAVARDRSRIRLSVSDQGCGFDAAAQGSFGLISMRERARMVGGELCISSTRGLGSNVRVTL
jgi:signal transduction histidine kinase